MPRRRAVLVLATAFAVALVIAGGAALFLNNVVTRAGPHEAEVRVLIEPGEGPAAIAAKLQSRGVIRNADFFRLYARLIGADRGLRAGEYAIAAQASLKDVLDTLRFGETVLRRLTVPEGMTSAQVVALLAEAEGLSGDIAGVPDEGTLLPETYYFSHGDDRAALLRRMGAAQDEVLAELWPGRAEGLPLAHVYEAVTLASIVEKETAVAGERPLVASVFVNRLERGMRLQSDPTVIYGVTRGDPLGRPIRQSELDAENPYNTYKIRGLPPGPIANPGRDALAAVLNPARSDYLYFVADGSGGHAFAKTLDEHNQNVARWRRLRDAR